MFGATAAQTVYGNAFVIIKSKEVNILAIPLVISLVPIILKFVHMQRTGISCVQASGFELVCFDKI